MEKIDSFSIEKHEGPYEKWPLKSRLFFNGHDTGTRVPGFIIEGQYKCDEGYLLITSQDCPFEESNDFILIDTSFHPIAKKQLRAPYGSFLIHAHWPISKTEVRLRYHEKLFFTLSIQKKLALFGSNRKLGLQQFYDFEGDPHAVASIAKLQESLKKTSETLANSR